MAHPKHRRCQICNVVTARYVGSQNAGPFAIRRWVTDSTNGEVSRVNGTVIRCKGHADK